jgi:hypothetical protein
MNKIMKQYLFLTVSVAFIVSCSGNGIEKRLPANEKYTIIKLNYPADGKLSLTDVFEKIDIIPLETTDNSLLSHIPKIDIDDTLLFLQNKHDKLVYVYDTAGKFKYKIGTEGQGPGEIWNPGVFALNKVKKEVWITNNFHKIFQYDYQGNLKGEIPLNLFFHDMYISGNEFIYFYASKFTNHNKDGGYDCWELWIKNIKDMDSEQYKIYFPYNYETHPNGGIYSRSISLPFSSSADGTVTFHYIYSDTVYSIKDDTVESKYVVDFGDKKADENLALKSSEQRNEYFQKNKGVAGSVNNVFETDDILRFTYFTDMKVHDVFYNKHSGKTVEGILDCKIYGAYLFLILAHRDEITGYLMPEMLDFTMENSWNFSETEINKLKSLTEDANPVLIRLKLKK